MTGRELIIYILKNKLENEDVFKDGKFIGFLTTSEAAVKLEVGPETIKTSIKLGLLKGSIQIGNEYLIPEETILKMIR